MQKQIGVSFFASFQPKNVGLPLNKFQWGFRSDFEKSFREEMLPRLNDPRVRHWIVQAREQSAPSVELTGLVNSVI
jgi:hypothetical protein